MVPSALMLMLSTLPAAAPFCAMDEVAEGDAKPVIVGVALASRISQVHALAPAPLVQVGVLSTTSAGAPPLTEASWPVALKVIVPVATWNGVPAVPPVMSAPGTVTA